MKKFTENINEKVNHYAGSQKIYNELYNLIDEHLTPKLDGEISDKISLIGKDSLVKELSKLVENEVTKSKISVLETFKKNPNMVNEDMFSDDFKEWFNANTESLSEEYQEYVGNMKLDGFTKKDIQSFRKWAKDKYNDI